MTTFVMWQSYLFSDICYICVLWHLKWLFCGDAETGEIWHSPHWGACKDRAFQVSTVSRWSWNGNGSSSVTLGKTAMYVHCSGIPEYRGLWVKYDSFTWDSGLKVVIHQWHWRRNYAHSLVRSPGTKNYVNWIWVLHRIWSWNDHQGHWEVCSAHSLFRSPRRKWSLHQYISLFRRWFSKGHLSVKLERCCMFFVWVSLETKHFKLTW